MSTNTTEQNSPQDEPAWLQDCEHPSAGATNKRQVFVTSYVKKHFLKISAQTRAGKFNRVSQEAIDKLEIAFEAKLKELMRDVPDPIGQVEPDDVFLTGYGKEKLQAAFNVWLAREMHRFVRNIRVGKTIQ